MRKPPLPSAYGWTVVLGYFAASVFGGACGAYTNEHAAMVLGMLAPQLGAFAHLLALRSRYA